MSAYRQSRRPTNSCPRCGEELIPVVDREALWITTSHALPKVAQGVRHCERCGGIFADLANSQRILLTLDRELLAIGFVAALGKQKPRDEGYALTCPECQLQMVKNRIESAACEVDACPLHGTWFDTGELVDVMRAFERARKKGILLRRDAPSAPVDLSDKGLDPPRVPSLIAWLSEWFS